eukprot:12329567-Alexandrium_andersonii.AAC.1
MARRVDLLGGAALLQGLSIGVWRRGRPPSLAASCRARGTAFGLVRFVLVLERRVFCLLGSRRLGVARAHRSWCWLGAPR